MLSTLQHRIASTIGPVLGEHGFALAGGAALIAHLVVDRQTYDLDYVATSSSAVQRLAPVVVELLTGDGLDVEVVKDADGFVRLTVADGADTCEVDLAWDARIRSVTSSALGPLLNRDELAADKVLALFGRARGRDFVDVDALLEIYTEQELLTLAASKDSGFSHEHFVEAMVAIGRLPRDDFPVDDQRLVRIRDRFSSWSQRLVDQLDRGGGDRSR